MTILSSPKTLKLLKTYILHSLCEEQADLLTILHFTMVIGSSFRQATSDCSFFPLQILLMLIVLFLFQTQPSYRFKWILRK